MRTLSCAVPRLAASVIAAAVVFAPVTAEAHYFTGGRLEMNYDYVYGSGGDSNSGGDRIDRTQTDGWDIDQLTYANSTQGAGYTAGVSVAINGWYSYTDFPTFTELTGAGYLDVAGEASGTGLALMNAGNPGSATTSNFTVTEESAYRLQGWSRWNQASSAPAIWSPFNISTDSSTKRSSHRGACRAVTALSM